MSRELSAIVCMGGVLTAAAFLISMIICPDFSMLFGLLIGWGCMAVCYVYLADTVNAISQMKDVRKAKRKMRICYMARFALLFALCFIGFETSLYDPLGVLIPQFFPKFILYYVHFVKKGKADGRT